MCCPPLSMKGFSSRGEAISRTAAVGDALRVLADISRKQPIAETRRGCTEPKRTNTGELDQLAINTIRTLSMTRPKAKSGHPPTIWHSGTSDGSLTRRTRFGPIATASSGQTATPRCCCGRLYLTGTRAVNAEYERLGKPSVTLDDIRHYPQPGSKAPDTRSITSVWCRGDDGSAG